jgi:hypothetical protein
MTIDWAQSSAWASSVGVIAFFVATNRTVSFLGSEMKLPGARHVDRSLVADAMAGHDHHGQRSTSGSA